MREINYIWRADFMRVAPVYQDVSNNMKKRIGIIGAGPAGLTAAYLLAKNQNEVIQEQKNTKVTYSISAVTGSFQNPLK
jgi:NADPH-dependent glutamate synthase beta subunit-like oxidoreductase